MMLFTIGFTKKSARTFFELIKSNNINVLIDIRLNNGSQLAGFSKGSDLEFFLNVICKCGYQYEPVFAPTKELMDSFKAKKISEEQFEDEFLTLMKARNALLYFEENFLRERCICLLCSEDTPEHCHRRILAEMIIEKYPHISLVHI